MSGGRITVPGKLQLLGVGLQTSANLALQPMSDGKVWIDVMNERNFPMTPALAVDFATLAHAVDVLKGWFAAPTAEAPEPPGADDEQPPPSVPALTPDS